MTVSVPAGPDRELTETLNSFLRNCTDLDRDVRFVILDQGLAAADRAVLAERYPFVNSARRGRPGRRPRTVAQPLLAQPRRRLAILRRGATAGAAHRSPRGRTGRRAGRGQSGDATRVGDDGPPAPGFASRPTGDVTF